MFGAKLFFEKGIKPDRSQSIFFQFFPIEALIIHYTTMIVRNLNTKNPTFSVGFFVYVPKAGIEPARPKAHDFESCASTNSATQAFLLIGLQICPKFKTEPNQSSINFSSEKASGLFEKSGFTRHQTEEKSSEFL
jgi:hypothetical protein